MQRLVALVEAHRRDGDRGAAVAHAALVLVLAAVRRVMAADAANGQAAAAPAG